MDQTIRKENTSCGELTLNVTSRIPQLGEWGNDMELTCADSLFSILFLVHL